ARPNRDGVAGVGGVVAIDSILIAGGTRTSNAGIIDSELGEHAAEADSSQRRQVMLSIYVRHFGCAWRLCVWSLSEREPTAARGRSIGGEILRARLRSGTLPIAACRE